MRIGHGRIGRWALALAGVLTLALPATAQEAGADRWPHAMRDRPLTLPQGMYSVGLSADIGALGGDPTVGLGVGGLWGASYGITDDFSLGVSYGFSVEPSSDGKGPLAIAAGYTTYAEGPLILTPTAGYTQDLVTEAGAVNLGLAYWFNFAGVLTLYDAGQQIAVAAEDGSATITIPLALGFQAGDPLFLGLSTTLMELLLADEGQYAFFGADGVPLGLTAIWSPIDALDIGVSLDFGDLADFAGENLGLGVSLIYYGGE